MSEHFEFYELDPPKDGDQPQLPPMFSSQEVLNGQSVFNKAVTAANSGDVGTVFRMSTNFIYSIHSIQFNLIQFNSMQFNSIQFKFNSIQLNSNSNSDSDADSYSVSDTSRVPL